MPTGAASADPTAAPDAIASVGGAPLEAPQERPAARREDLSGRSNLAWNVLTGWGSYAVYIVAGFVLPRFMDEHIGKNALGVWDFGFSVVSYFALAQIGIGSSVNRFVAATRAGDDIDGLRRIASTLTVMLLPVALLVTAIAGVFAWLLPVLFPPDKFAELIGPAQWVVFLLGINLAVQQATDLFNGVLTGCHRWDLHNAITSGAYLASVLAMLAAMMLGGGLISLALITLATTVLAQTLRGVACFRVCPGLGFGWRYVRRDTARALLGFGGKTIVPRLADLLTEQTVSVMITASMGPAALAVFSRPRGLFRHVTTLVARLSFVLEPTVGSLQASGDRDALTRLLIRATSVGAYLALPTTILLLMLGNPILMVWMGPDYAIGPVMTVMALGSLVTVGQLPVQSVLVGLNAHGRIGVARLAASIVAVLFAYVAIVQLHWGLLGAAIAVTVPLVTTLGIYVPLRACRELRLPLSVYFRDAWLGPLTMQLPFVLALALAVALIRDWNLATLALAVAPASLALALSYWRGAVPPELKSKLIQRARRVIGRRAENRV